NYAADSGYFIFNGVDNPPLRALANGVEGGNGVYRYGASGFPTESFNGANYWVDVVFSTSASTASGGTVSVPNVVGQPQATATSMLVAAGLIAGTISQASSNTMPAGSVISQSPAADSNVEAGSAVDLVVSSGPALATLTVSRTGNGSGTVTSTPAGIDCGATCSADYNHNTSVTLTAAASTGSTFSGWSGACTGTGSCVVTMDAAKNVTANFTLNQYTLTILKVGSGTVASSPSGINCGSVCVATFNHNTVVNLTAVGATGWTFAGWQGDLSGAASPQALTMDGNKTVTATFSDLIFADGFESGNFSAWSSSTTDGGDLSVTAAAALVGAQGMRAQLDDNDSIYVTDTTPNAETHYWASFHFDPNSISMSNGNAHYIFYGYSGSSTVVLRIEFRRSSNNYQIRAQLRNNSTTWTTSNWFTISDAPHQIAIDWQAATSSGAANGFLTLWIDGNQVANLTGVANGNRRIDSVQLGAVAGVDSGTRGTYYFDAFESRRNLPQ
ncbi:MAG: hypothetical protein DCC55_31965, partial [Chloroflexi bacterium]